MSDGKAKQVIGNSEFNNNRKPLLSLQFEEQQEEVALTEPSDWGSLAGTRVKTGLS